MQVRVVPAAGAGLDGWNETSRKVVWVRDLCNAVLAFCTKMDIEDKLRESVSRRPVANGLAIIIANEYSSNPSHPPLHGARRDLENMKDTFELLRFATLPILNASTEQVLAAIRAAAEYDNYPPSYKRIAFAFSGHGDQNVIYAHDGVIATNQLYDPLQPKNAPHLAHIPKLFFMDACRGPNEDRGVEVVARGKTEPPRTRIPVPSYGNYVLAFSTMPSMRAYELKDVGGVWMNIVSKELRTNRKSILDVLTEVNGKLLNEFRLNGFEFYQQPVLESALIEPFGLLEEAEKLDTQVDVQLSFPPHNEDQEIVIGSQVYPSDSAIPPHSTHKPSSHTLTVPHSDMKPLAPVFMGTTLLKQQPPPQRPPQRPPQQYYQQPQWFPTYPTNPDSRPVTYVVPSQPHYETKEPTAHVATIGPNSHLQSAPTHYPAQLQVGEMRQYQPLTVNQHVGGPLPIPAHSQYYATNAGSSSATTTGGAYHASSTEFSVEQTSLSHGQPAISKPLGRYREVLNHYKQIGDIQNYYFDDTELYDQTKMQMCYSSQVTVILPNSIRVVMGSSSVYPQKQLAREEAAKSAVQQLECLLPKPVPHQPKPVPHQPQKDVSTGSAVPSHSESSSSEDSRTQLNSFCQAHGIKPQFSFIEDASSWQTRYKCTINYTVNGRPERINSTGHYASKGAAKEEAARMLISKETSRMVLSRGATPTTKIWKSELKEYYDKRGRAGVPLKYETKECPKNGYQCTLFAPDVGYVRGDICRSKSEAEHNAAYKVLQKLKSD